MNKSSSESKSLTEEQTRRIVVVLVYIRLIAVTIELFPMSNQQDTPQQKTKPRRRWQYGIGTMLLVMIPFSILAGALSGMIDPDKSGSHLPRAFYVVLAIIAPMGLMVALSLILVLRKWMAQRRRR